MRSFLHHFVIALWVGGLALPVGAGAETQRIYRCGNAYTNHPEPNANCKALSGGSVTVIEGTRIQVPQVVAPLYTHRHLLFGSTPQLFPQPPATSPPPRAP